MSKIVPYLIISLSCLTRGALALAVPGVSHIRPRDTFDISRFAYLGDSFAAGPGAGRRYGNWSDCFRSEDAWGPLVVDDKRRRGKQPIEQFDFNACTGATTEHIHATGQFQNEGWGSGDGDPSKPQASLLQGRYPGLVTLSIGGNDVGFFKLLDRCVYRFYNPGCQGCQHLFDPRDDCTNDCREAMFSLESSIDSKDFQLSYNKAIESIFANAPDTHLFITGYPRFWNQDTDECNTVSFKVGCNDNWILPLIKERRAKMNELTLKLNEKIKSFIAAYPISSGSITYVDTDPFFEGHRFCEPGVKEPSYRNDNIWFFPFEYSAKGKTPVNATSSEDCEAVGEQRGQEKFFACQLGRAVAEGAEIDLSTFPNNVEGDDDPPIDDPQGFPLALTRIFHPTKKGHEAYREAFYKAYLAYQEGGSSPSKSGVKCRGLKDNYYVTKGTVSDLITNTYCPKLAGMSDSIGTGHYLSGTPDAVEIWAGPRLDSQAAPTPEQCVKNLHVILDECDTDGSSNPMDWKAGGEVEVDKWSYSITTKKPRPQAPKKPSAWCQLEGCNKKNGCTARLWGAGWLNSGFGHELREGFELQQAILTDKDAVQQLGSHLGIDVSLWGEEFRYEVIDKHEWTVTLQMDVGAFLDAGKLVVDTMKAVANPKDLGFLQVGSCQLV